jgi:hypothetical protein
VKRSFSCALACASVALAGGACGGGDSSSGSDVVSAPEAEEPLEEHLANVNQAIANGDCEIFIEEEFSQTRFPGKGSTELVEPGAPASPSDCRPASRPLLGGLKGVDFTPTQESGPAAVSEGTADKPYRGYDHWALVSLVDRDRRWREVTYFQVQPQSEDPSPDADPGAVVNELLKAVRAGDCTQAKEIFDPVGRLARANQTGNGSGGAAGACEAVVKGIFFAPSLRETPEAEVEPEELLTTRDISIWGVPTKEACYTVFLGTPPTTVGAPPSATFLVSDINLLTEAEPG